MEQVVGDVFEDGLDLFAAALVEGSRGVGDRRLVHEMFHGDGVTRQQRCAPAEAGRERDIRALHLDHGVHDQLIESAVKVAAPVECALGDGELLFELGLVRRAHLLDVRRHLGVRFDQVGEDRQQLVAVVGYFAALDLEIQHRQELAVRAGIADQGLAGFVRDQRRGGDRIVCVAAQNRIDAGDARGHLQVHVHAVVREYHHGLGACGARLVDHLLHAVVVDAEAPVRNHPAWVGNRCVRERLTDDGDRHTVQFADDIGLEHRLAPGRVAHVLGEELDAALEVLVDNFLDALGAIGELPVSGHDVHAQQLLGVHHVLALGPERGGRALPGVAAIQQQGAALALVAQAFHQRGEVCKAANLAVLACSIFKIEIGKGVRLD